MKKYSKRNRENITELLESDDEIPESYKDIAHIPAYQNDSRFSSIKFSWLDNYLSQSKSKPPASKTIPRIVPSDQENGVIDEKSILISKGFLTKRDLFFVKSIEDMLSATSLHWFIEFLQSKNINGKPSKSCLVGDYCCDSLKLDICPNFNTRYYLKLIVPKE